MMAILAITAILAMAVRQDVAGTSRELYARAEALEARNDFPAALSLLWEAAGLAPRDAEIQNRLGEALERIGALDAAVDAYRAALAARPDFRKASNNLILALVKTGTGGEAVERARALAAEAPADPERHFTLGLALAEQDVEEAMRTFQHVLELAPRHALARYNLALVLSRVDRAAAAIDELRRAIAIDPRPEMYQALASVYRHQGDLEGAAGALRHALAANDRNADVHAALGAVLREQGDLPRSAAALRRAIEMRPDVPATHYLLAQVLRSAGDEGGARARFAEAERLRAGAEREREAGVWTAVGAQHLERGDPARALESFRRAATVMDTYAPAFYQMGRALERLGQSDAARTAFARARQLNPGLVRAPDRQ